MSGMGKRRVGGLLAAFVLGACAARPVIVDGAIPAGSGEQTAMVGGQAFQVFTFGPLAAPGAFDAFAPP